MNKDQWKKFREAHYRAIQDILTTEKALIQLVANAWDEARQDLSIRIISLYDDELKKGKKLFLSRDDMVAFLKKEQEQG